MSEPTNHPAPSNARRPRVVAFDLGHVLLDVDKGALCRELRLPWELVEPAFFGEGRHDALTCGAMSAEAYLEGAADRLRRSFDEVERAWASMVGVSEGAAALVEAVPLPVVAWSNTDDVHFRAFRDGLPARLWERRTLSQEVRAAKPEPAFYLAGLERLGVTAADVVFLDDLAPNVAAARALGIDAEQVVGVQAARAALEKRGIL